VRPQARDAAQRRRIEVQAGLELAVCELGRRLQRARSGPQVLVRSVYGSSSIRSSLLKTAMLKLQSKMRRDDCAQLDGVKSAA
jgi:hypothetical protein